jgi:NADH:ubiquinone oxidoreductase subunit 2 (subunit N)
VNFCRTCFIKSAPGVLAIVSSVILVAFYARLEEMLTEKYERMMKSKPSPHMQTVIATSIIVAIVANLVSILMNTRFGRKLFG